MAKSDRAYFHVNEFRGFEKFCEGRMVFEMPSITPRICGICPVSHHLASAKAGDAVMGCPPPRPASLLRELMHMGQIIQSHGMHFFELAGPDLLLGFDADPAIRNVIGLVSGQPRAGRQSSRPAQIWARHHLHPRRTPGSSQLRRSGGVNKALHASERDAILAGLDDSIATIQTGLADHTGLGRRRTWKTSTSSPSSLPAILGWSPPKTAWNCTTAISA